MEKDEPEPIVLELAHGPEARGHVKSELDDLAGTVDNSGFYISISRISEIHGWYEDSAAKRYASLIMLQFDLGNENSSQVKRFKFFQPTITFETDPEPDMPRGDPTVMSYGPAQQDKGALIVTESSTKITESYSAQGNIQGQAPGTSIGGQVIYTKGKEYSKPYYYKVSGRHLQKTKGKDGVVNMVRWTLSEDAKTGVGVGDSIRIAVIIERPKDLNFKIHIDTRAKADWKYWITEKARQLGDLMGLREQSEFDGGGSLTLEYDRTKSSKKVPDGIDRNNLGEAAKKDLLDNLAYLHTPERILTKEFYKSGQ
jgi:hypothetical protein